MRKLLLLCVLVFVGLLSFDANPADAATVWASGASVISQTSGITAPRSILRATGVPDKQRWEVYAPLTAPMTNTEIVVAQWTFGTGVPGNLAPFALFTHVWSGSGGTPNGTVTAQVVSYTAGGSTTAVTGTPVLIAKFFNVPTAIHLPYQTPGAATTITAVNVRFTIVGAGWFRMDSFGIPEPGTFALFGAGLLGMGLLARKQRARMQRRRKKVS